MCANAFVDARPHALATHSPNIPCAASVTHHTRVHSSALSHARPPTHYSILWQERDENVIWRGEIVERQVIQTITNNKQNDCWPVMSSVLDDWNVVMKCVWEFTRKVRLYLADSVTASSAVIFRLSSTLWLWHESDQRFFLNSWRRHFIPEELKGYATSSVIVLFQRECFIHRMFFSLTSCEGSAVTGTAILHMIYDISYKLHLGGHPVAVVQYTFTHKQHTERHKTNDT
jgi:hypothetical protein